jgi:hypothetical protein|tara:strand:+ start:741 stop:905 length:165 start_codon:yes stop_codon:yes gene_type:complete
MIEVGDLVTIKQSFSQKLIGKTAIVLRCFPWNARIKILHTGEIDEYGLSKLEKL